MKRSIIKRIKCLALIVLVMFVVHGINVLMNGWLNVFGIIPGSMAHWFHVFTAPFIHADLAHLTNNVVGLVVFSSLCLARSIGFYLFASVFIISLTGGLVWLFGREAVHIGASGWVFGLWSLSLALAWFDRRFINILTACLVFFFYGGMIYGVLPSDPKISFEAHLFGALSGAMFAFLYSVYKRWSTEFFSEKS